MTYLDALNHEVTQYAINSGKIDDFCEKEIVEWTENIMRKAAEKKDIPAYPQNGYVYIRNMYAEFAKKIINGKEQTKESELDCILELIDSGLLRPVSHDKKRAAVYYSLEAATLGQMKKLYTETTARLERAQARYEDSKKSNTGRVYAAAEVNLLTRRVGNQMATIRFMERHSK